MNFYKRHIGDYLKDTAHLSLLEHGVYTRLLDVYYTRESGIPDDQAARLIGARARDEVAALKVVLGEFFELVDGTWIQQRCEREIADAAEGEIDRDAKRENERDRQRRHRDRRRKLFDELRKHDIVPPYDTSTEQLQAILSRVTGRDNETYESRPVTQPVTRDATANQTPDSRLQTKTTGTVVVTADSHGIARDDDDSSPRNNAEWIRYFADRHGVEIDHMSAHQRAKAFPLFAAWTKAGVTRRQVDTAVAKAQAEATEPIAFLPAYVDRVLASMAAPRASPQPSWSDQNAQTIAALTGRNRSHGPDDRIIDV
ncbi:YdaU family protein [Burkholderia multivorans]|nr:YdaU family protein [Burkholderia multivorans]